MKILNKLVAVLPFALIGIGVLLSLIQFFDNRSLWIDEAKVAINVIDRNPYKLLRPLKYSQVAPVLFLEVEKIFTWIVPNSDYGLRIFPLISYWFSLAFFYKILKKITDKPLLICLSLCLFVLNFRLIYFSSEVKQYIVDLMVIMGLYYFTIKDYETNSKRFKMLSMVGTVSILLSHIAPVALLCVGLFLFLEWNKRKEFSFNQLVKLGLVWLGFFSLNYVLFVYNHPTKGMMLDFWGSRGAFLSGNPLTADFWRFFTTGFYRAYASILIFKFESPYVLLGLLLLGSLHLIRKSLGLFVLIVCPVIIHLSLSAFEAYPFYLRLVIYTFPLIIVLVTFAIGNPLSWITEKFGKAPAAIATILVLVPFMMSFAQQKQLPVRRNEFKQSVGFLKQNIAEDDSIYVHFGARHAFNYYRKIGMIDLSNYSNIGFKWKKENRQECIQEIGEFTGRTWVLFSHLYFKNEDALILEKLDSLGYQQLLSFKTKGSSVYLYDTEKTE